MIKSMNKNVANITRTTLCMADDMVNAHGVSEFQYEEKSCVLGLINRIINTSGLTEIGDNSYQGSWVFLFNNKPIACITHEKNKITIRAFMEVIPSVKKDIKVNFHFEHINNNTIVEFLLKKGLHQNFIVAQGIENL